MERAEKKNMGRERAAILIIAYKEPHRFQRLLESVSRACYNEDRVDLIISIDKSDPEWSRWIPLYLSASDHKY